MNIFRQSVFATLTTFAIGFGLGNLVGIAIMLIWHHRRGG